MIGPRAAPSSPRSPFPAMHRRVIKALTNSEGLGWPGRPTLLALPKAKLSSLATSKPLLYRGSSTTFRFEAGAAFFSLKATEVGEHSAQRANMPGSAHLRTPFEALSRVNRSRVASLVPHGDLPIVTSKYQ